MILQLEQNATPELQASLSATLSGLGFSTTAVRTQQGRYLVCIGSTEIDIRRIGGMPGVQDVHRVSDAYKLVSRKWKHHTSKICLADVVIGGDAPVIMAGPCSIESEEQVLAVASHLRDHGVRIMRGGVFKPRSSPYAFQGSGIEGLRMFHRICSAHGIFIVSEVMDISQIQPMHDFVDIYQVGARNTQNFNLLRALGETGKPVLLKRGISGSIDELLQSAEYIFSSGNEQIMLCERGIRSFENAYRNTFDINAIPILRQKSHLPVIADPSHGIGIREHVPAVALAAIAAGANGIIYEVHQQPEKAFSDSGQTLSLDESATLIRRIDQLKQLLTMH